MEFRRAVWTVVIMFMVAVRAEAQTAAPSTEHRVPSTEHRVPSTVSSTELGTENWEPGTRSQMRAQMRAQILWGLPTLAAPIDLAVAANVDSLDRRDPWLGFDKVQHLTFSFLWTLGTQYVVVNKGRSSEHHALPLSIASSAAAGIAKELYDRHRGAPTDFSLRDLAADAAGILLATGVILLE